MKQTVTIVQMVIGIIFIILILIQSRGTGFSRSTSSASFTRRGLEKVVFKITFVLAGLFILISLLPLII